MDNHRLGELIHFTATAQLGTPNGRQEWKFVFRNLVEHTFDGRRVGEKLAFLTVLAELHEIPVVTVRSLHVRDEVKDFDFAVDDVRN